MHERRRDTQPAEGQRRVIHYLGFIALSCLVAFTTVFALTGKALEALITVVATIAGAFSNYLTTQHQAQVGPINTESATVTTTGGAVPPDVNAASTEMEETA